MQQRNISAGYYVNKNPDPNGDHEVHTSDCRYMPREENRIYLGTFDKCRDAVQAAKKHYPKAHGCSYCIKECHTE